MARHQHFVIADQDWVDEPGLGDRSRDLRRLLFGMGAGIGRMRDQSVERPELDSKKNDGVIFAGGVSLSIGLY